MIGTYYRLSLADEDVGADKAESNSIQGQRGLVEGYIMARPELATEPRQEYVDDGYSGTSTSRPAFQRLIQDAQDGKVKTIIVKDGCVIIEPTQKGLENQGFVAGSICF